MKSIKIFLFIFLAFFTTNINNVFATDPVTDSVRIVVNCVLTYTAGTGGTITGTNPQTIECGTSGTAVTAVPSATYSFTGWSDGVTTASRTDLNVAGNISVQANFAKNNYTLTYIAGTGGTITGTNPQTIVHGGNGSSVTASASLGYVFADWSDGLTTPSRTDLNITADKTVTANFNIKSAPSVSVIEPATFITSSSATMSAEVTSNGNDSSLITRSICYGISPNPTSCHSAGTGMGVFSYDATGLTPSTRYYFRGKATNDTGTAYSSDGSFVTLPIDAIVIFVTPNPSEYNVSRGANVNFTYTSSTSSGAGTECKLLNNEQIAFSADYSSGSSISHTVPSEVGSYLYFIKCRDKGTISEQIISSGIYVYTKPSITVNQTANGTIAPSTSEIIYGSNSSYSITPATGYRVDSLIIDGSTISASNSYTFANVTSDRTISATYIFNLCSNPTYQEVTGIQCDLNSNGDAAISGSVTRSQVKTDYPDCQFPSPITKDNSIWVRDDCVYQENYAPSVSSPTATDVNSSGATLGATVSSLGSPASISARGICYGGSLNPSLANATCVTASGTTIGPYSIVFDTMSYGSLYHYRGFATNETGTGYSSDATFNTGSDPDLISSQIIPPFSMMEGISQNFTALITNQGGGSTISGFWNLFQISTGPAGTGTMSEAQAQSGYYDPGNSAWINFGVTFPSAGTYYGRSCADKRTTSDQDGDIDESDEGNNCGAWVTLTVQSSNTLPLAPTIGFDWDNPVSSGFNNVFDISGTDPDIGNQVQYGIDWNNDGTVETIDWTSLVNSGIHMFPEYSWTNPTPNPVNHLIRGLTKDSKGGISPWSDFYTVIVQPHVNEVKINSFNSFDPVTSLPSNKIPVGGSVTLTWITSDATGGCTMKEGSIPVNMSDVLDDTNGSKTFTPTTTKKVRYTLTCLGDNNSIDSEFRDIMVGNIKPIYTEF